jgi:hypothetical protein
LTHLRHALLKNAAAQNARTQPPYPCARAEAKRFDEIASPHCRIVEDGEVSRCRHPFRGPAINA